MCLSILGKEQAKTVSLLNIYVVNFQAKQLISTIILLQISVNKHITKIYIQKNLIPAFSDILPPAYTTIKLQVTVSIPDPLQRICILNVRNSNCLLCKMVTGSNHVQNFMILLIIDCFFPID